MRRYWAVAGAIVALLLVLYAIVELLDVPVLSDPSRALGAGGAAAAVIGLALLVLDAVLPVPSSLVMIAHGALFGAAVGAILSLVGRLGFAVVGFAIGRRGGPLLERLVTPAERVRADRLLRRWGALAIVLTRPVPLLAETTTILAGASTMSWPVAIGAALAGSAPEAVLYALTGAVAATFQNAALLFVLLLVVATAAWIVLRVAHGRAEDDAASGQGVAP